LVRPFLATPSGLALVLTLLILEGANLHLGHHAATSHHLGFGHPTSSHLAFAISGKSRDFLAIFS
jgi:hypothetical protein